MATTYPTTKQTLPNPGPLTYRDDPGFELDVVVATLGDTVEALQDKLGLGASIAAANQVLRATGAGASAFGQIVTGDLVANAVTLGQSATPTTSSPTTSSGTPGDMPQMTVTQSVTAGSLFLILFSCALYNGAANSITAFTLLYDGGQVLQRSITSKGANLIDIVTLFHVLTVPTTKSVITKMQWHTNANTSTTPGLERGLTIVEFKK